MGIVRNIHTNDFYRFNGGNNFTNIRTGESGEVSDEAAKRTFRIHLAATEIINEFPVIEEMINRLNLKNDQSVVSLQEQG